MIVNTFTHRESELFAAQVAAATCNQLVKLKVLDTDKAEEFLNGWSPILIAKESLLLRLWKFFGLDTPKGKEALLIRFVCVDTDREMPNAVIRDTDGKI